MPAAVPVVDDFNYVDNGSEGPEEVRSDSSLEVLDEEAELGRSTQGWDSFDCFICYCASGWAKILPRRPIFMIFTSLLFVPTKAGRNFAQLSSHCEFGILQHCLIPAGQQFVFLNLGSINLI